MRNGTKHTFVLPDEMADVSIAGLQWFILIPRLNHTGSRRPFDSHSIPYLHREKKLLQTYELRAKQPFVSDFSRLLRHAIEEGRGPILYSKKKKKKNQDPTGKMFKEIADDAQQLTDTVPP